MQYCLRSRWCLCALLVPLLCAHSLLQSPDLPDLNVQLVAAAADGDLAAVADLLERGADVNADNGFGVTSLYTAADWGNLDLVTLLIEHGADPDSNPASRGRSPWGKTPPQLAAATNTDVRVPEARAAIVELLVERGGGSAGEALVDLIRRGYYDAARTIVGRGEATASYLNLALTAATRAGQAELVTLLTEAGARAPSPVDQARATERLELIVGVYRSGPAETLTLILGLVEGELLLQREGQPSVAVGPANQTLLRSRDRSTIIELGGRTLPPTELTLYEAGESSVFGRDRRGSRTAGRHRNHPTGGRPELLHADRERGRVAVVSRPPWLWRRGRPGPPDALGRGAVGQRRLEDPDSWVWPLQPGHLGRPRVRDDRAVAGRDRVDVSWPLGGQPFRSPGVCQE